MRKILEENVIHMKGITNEVKEQAKSEVFDYLRSTGREGVEELITWLLDSPYLLAPASENDHNSFRGGLLCHTLNTCRRALKIRQSKIRQGKYTAEELPEDSVILAALLHDTCKCYGYIPVGQAWIIDREERAKGHGRRSVEILEKEVGLPLTDEEKLAIRWHDGKGDYDCQHGGEAMIRECEEAYQKSPLLNVIHQADSAMAREEKRAQKAGFFLPLHYIEESGAETQTSAEPPEYPIGLTLSNDDSLTFVGVGDLRIDQVCRVECNPTFTRGTEEVVVSQEVGGSLGNEACLLSQFGWTCYPVARLDHSPLADRLVADLHRFGVNTLLVSQSEQRGGYGQRFSHWVDPQGRHETKYGVLNIRRKKFDSTAVEGRHCSYKPVSSRDGQVEAILRKASFCPKVFYLGDTNLGHLQLAKAYKRRGSVVVFEPTKAHDNHVRRDECLALSDIIKASEKDCTNLDALVPDKSGKLLVVTCGDRGARFNLRGEGWVEVPAPENRCLVDPTGSGDVFGAVLLNQLARQATLRVVGLDQQQVREAVEVAIRYASYSVSFYGAKGFWYQNPEVVLTPGETEPLF